MTDNRPDDPSSSIPDQAMRKKRAIQAGFGFPLILFLTLLLAIAGGSFFLFEKQSQTEVGIIKQNLAGIAELKSDQIQQWLIQNKANIEGRSNTSQIANHIGKWLEHGAIPGDEDAKWIENRFRISLDRYFLGEMTLVDMNGKPLISTNPALHAISAEPALLRQAIDRKKPVMSEMHWHTREDGSSMASVHVASPVIPANHGGEIVGVLWVELDIYKHFFPMIQRWPTPSETAETVLFTLNGDDAVFLNETGNQHGATLPLRVSLGKPEALITQAAHGKMGILDGTDYRDEPAIGYAVRIPDTNWIMVSKINTAEVYAPIRHRTISNFVLATLLLCISSLSMYYWWRQRDSSYRESQLQHQLHEQFLARQNEYLSKYANDIILLLDKTGSIIEANDRAESAYGLPRFALIGKNIRDIRSPSEAEPVERQLKKILDEKGMVFETFHVRADGNEFPVEVSARTIRHGYQTYVQCITRDITERKAAQERERYLTDMYRAISATNEAIIRVESESELFPRVCRIAVEHGGMVLAWVGIPDSRGWFTPVASHGRTADYLDDLPALTTPDGRFTARRAFLENHPSVANDIGLDDASAEWRGKIARYAVQSIAAFPILRAGIPHAVLAVYSDHADAFRQEIASLLEGMAANISFALDNFDRKASQRSASESLKLAAMVYQDSSEAMIVTDVGNRIVAVNPAFEQITGYRADGVIGRQSTFLMSDREDADSYRSAGEAIGTTGRWKGELWIRTRDGRDLAIMLSVNTTFSANGSVQRRVALFSDITSRKESDEMIWNQANFDSLTGLPNRRLFRDHLRQEIRKSRRAGQRLALMFLDLDGFKDINDTLGHDMGDLLLKNAAERLNASVREVDIVARLGGDEFTVILSDLHDPGNIERIARGILRKLSEPFQLGDEVAHVTASIGITFYPDDAAELEDLLKNADQAMYASKQGGKNQYRFFTAEMQDAAMERMRLINDLRIALDEDQFELVYQPILDVASGCILKAEALIRWQHPVRGIINPAEFIPLAEDTGLINSFGDWVFREAARQAARWRETFHPQFQISVNISPVQFRNDGIDSTVWFRHLETLGLQARGIVVEITEGLLLDADPSVTAQLLALRDAGIEVALDDFGVGYSSLSYLQKFDIDYIKIDQSFVRNLGEGSSNLALCEAIIVMAHKLGLKVIAEGVELELQRRLLTDAGCDFLQGFLIAGPLPASAMEQLLEVGDSLRSI